MEKMTILLKMDQVPKRLIQMRMMVTISLMRMIMTQTQLKVRRPWFVFMLFRNSTESAFEWNSYCIFFTSLGKNDTDDNDADSTEDGANTDKAESDENDADNQSEENGNDADSTEGKNLKLNFILVSRHFVPYLLAKAETDDKDDDPDSKEDGESAEKAESNENDDQDSKEDAANDDDDDDDDDDSKEEVKEKAPAKRSVSATKNEPDSIPEDDLLIVCAVSLLIRIASINFVIYTNSRNMKSLSTSVAVTILTAFCTLTIAPLRLRKLLLRQPMLHSKNWNASMRTPSNHWKHFINIVIWAIAISAIRKFSPSHWCYWWAHIRVANQPSSII